MNRKTSGIFCPGVPPSQYGDRGTEVPSKEAIPQATLQTGKKSHQTWSGEGLPVRAGTDSLPVHSRAHSRQGTTSNISGNSVVTDQGSSSRGQSTHRPVYQQAICDPKKDGSLWPVVNLKPLNCFMENHHFKMEGMNKVRELLRYNNSNR